jgi:hypothetical protein
MSELKTQKTDASIEEFLESVEHPVRQQDSYEVLEIMREITGEKGSMWGGSIIGFGEFTYTNTTKKENQWFKTGFSPRKSSLTLYLMDEVDSHQEILSRLGKHKTGKGCLYINKLEDVDLDVLKELITVTYGKV